MSYQLFIKKTISESILIEAIESVTGVKCESLDLPKDDAIGFLMSNYCQGEYPLEINFSWPRTHNLKITLNQFCSSLSSKLNVGVLFESEDSISDTNQEKWLLVYPNKTPCRVGVIDENGFISIAK